MTRATAALLCALPLLALATGCQGRPSHRDQAALVALDASLRWLAEHHPPPQTSLGARVLDLWSWERFATLHPDAALRERAAGEARERLERLGLPGLLDFVTLSYWATALRARASLGMETEGLTQALAGADLERLLGDGSSTTGFWSGELLRYSGVAVPSGQRPVALRIGSEDPDWQPSVRDAVAFYHEIAAASDLGRAPVRDLSPDEQRFARRVHPLLLSHVRGLGHTDAAAEVLIGAAMLGQRGEDWIHEGIDWLLTRQRPDGSFARSGERPVPTDDDRRHGVLVVSWALLEHLGSR